MSKEKEQSRRQILNMYLLANADGDFDPQEQILLMEKAVKLGISHDELFDLVEQANEYRIASPPDTLIERVKGLYDLALIVWSDGIVKPEEKEMLHSFVLQYGFLEENASEIVDYLLEQVQGGVEVESIVRALTE